MERSVNKKKIQKRYDEEFERQAVQLVIHTGKRNLTFNVLCLICFGFQARYSASHKAHSASGRHNLQVGSVLPATIRAPAGVMRSNAAPVFARGWQSLRRVGPFFLKKTTQLKPPIVGAG